MWYKNKEEIYSDKVFIQKHANKKDITSTPLDQFMSSKTSKDVSFIRLKYDQNEIY